MTNSLLEDNNLDKFLENNREFWSALETECVAECCGIDAYDFSEEAIKEIIESFDSNRILDDLNTAIQFIEVSKSEHMHSTIFNCYATKKESIELFKNIKQVLLSVSV